MGMWCTRRSSNTVVRRTKRTSSVMWACCNLACKALTVAALACILILTGVSSCAVVTEMSMETYTCLLMDANPKFPIHFLNIYNWLRVSDTTEGSQVDQRIGHQLHAIVPVLETFKSEQQPLAFVLRLRSWLRPLPSASVRRKSTSQAK